jgi:hypothetical protein
MESFNRYHEMADRKDVLICAAKLWHEYASAVPRRFPQMIAGPIDRPILTLMARAFRRGALALHSPSIGQERGFKDPFAIGDLVRFEQDDPVLRVVTGQLALVSGFRDATMSVSLIDDGRSLDLDSSKHAGVVGLAYAIGMRQQPGSLDGGRLVVVPDIKGESAAVWGAFSRQCEGRLDVVYDRQSFVDRAGLERLLAIPSLAVPKLSAMRL